jgi:N utilization substance protein A
MPGLSRSMLVSLGENGVKSVEDLADCATDDLIGWTEKKDGVSTRHKGFLEEFDLARDEAEQLILNARIHAGWLEPEPEPEPEPEEDGAEDNIDDEAEIAGETDEQSGSSQ